jgi:predicted metal-dependent peptidase
MTERMLGLAVTEIKGLLVAVGIQNDAIRVISCDAGAEEAQKVRNVNDLLLKGGGGTDLRVGIENATKLIPRPELIIVVTDGGTPWPDERVQGVEMFALLIGDNPPQPPNWIHCVSAKVES